MIGAAGVAVLLQALHFLDVPHPSLYLPKSSGQTVVSFGVAPAWERLPLLFQCVWWDHVTRMHSAFVHRGTYLWGLPDHSSVSSYLG